MVMTVETRYFRDDEKLGTSNTTTGDAKYIIPTGGQGYIGIKVYVNDVCISGDNCVALKTIPADAAEVDGTWDCPVQASAGIVKVEVYACLWNGTVPQLIETFVTTDSVKLDAATWTVHYWCDKYYEYPYFYIDFYYGDVYDPSRITNFTWSAVGIASKRLLVGVGV